MKCKRPVCQHKPEPIDFELMCKSGCSGEGNPPLEPRGLEVEFFPKEEVLHEKVKIYR